LAISRLGTPPKRRRGSRRSTNPTPPTTTILAGRRIIVCAKIHDEAMPRSLRPPRSSPSAIEPGPREILIRSCCGCRVMDSTGSAVGRPGKFPPGTDAVVRGIGVRFPSETAHASELIRAVPDVAREARVLARCLAIRCHDTALPQVLAARGRRDGVCGERSQAGPHDSAPACATNRAFPRPVRLGRVVTRPDVACSKAAPKVQRAGGGGARSCLISCHRAAWLPRH
jgi:hypothetical protein